jgi:nucleotide-binding universal stress UspA family protein
MFNEPLDELIQESPCPLLVVSTEVDGDGQANQPLQLERILLPIWGSKSDRVGAEVAFAMANEGDLVVDVLHVVDRDQHRSRTGSDEGLRNAVEIGEDMVEKVAEFGRSMGARVHTEVVVARQVEEAVIDHARHHADLIVLESNRAPVTQRAFFGHHVDYVLREAPCPVVVVGMP